IGTVLVNGKFECNQRQCSSKTFGRPAELRRHYATIHAVQKPEFWCHIVSCERSKPFSRKDKLTDHVRKAHD
ncbi:uncharacterized protein K460DRAFT_258993, partial [Cucurbitaria berberidis CBS 394.84]